jgi:hypothetical protein
MMKRRYYFLLIPVILAIGIVVGLNFTGYLFNDQRIIPPSSPIEWENFDEVVYANTSTKSNTTAYPYLVILNFTEQMKDIPGVEYIKYKVFVSNDSRQQVIDYYTDILEKEGYSYHDEYSSMMTYDYSKIYYYTFTKGLNGVVIYLSEYHQQTWICYSTSDIIHYKLIFDYMTTHNII